MNVNPCDIYNKYTNNITVAFKDNIVVDADGQAEVRAARTKKREKFLLKGFQPDGSDNIILIECPIDILAIELESHATEKDSHETCTKEQRDEWIAKTAENATKYGLQWCIADHSGTSKYFYCFNLIGLPVEHELESKKHIAKMLLPNEAFKFLDKTNLGKTLIPVIGRPHWKPKYNGAIHEVKEGINPVEHINNIHHLILGIIYEDKKIKTNDCVIDEIKSKSKLNDYLIEFNYDLSKNPTMCKLGHDSEKGRCFSYDLNQGLWYCHHCNKGGDVFDFIREHRNVDFSAAKTELTRKYNIIDPCNTLPQGILIITNYRENAAKFWNIQKFFYDENRTFFLWNKENYKWVSVDEIDMMNAVDKSIKMSGETINSQIKGNYLEAFKRIGREKTPIPPENSWVQFKDTIIDVLTGETKPATSDYFITNPIPWNIGESEDTPMIDKFLHEWVVKEGLQDESYVRTMYEILAYCMLYKQFLQRMIALTGSGSNGKGCFLRLIRKFLGEDNVSTSELRTLSDNNFETAALYKKLVCLMGEVDAYDMSNTKLLKKLTGEDLIRYEFKGKNQFSAESYTTCVIATNSLPVTPDKSIGFYRRWLIVDFPHTFAVGPDIIELIPEIEYSNLAKKSIRIAKELWTNYKFTNEGDIHQRTERYERRSNPIEHFIKEYCNSNPDYSVPFSNFMTKFNNYLKSQNLRSMNANQLGRALKREGFEKKIIENRLSLLGLCIKEDKQSFFENFS